MRRRPRRPASTSPHLSSLLLLALPHVAHSIILADFQPAIDSNSLTRQCAIIYTSPVPGCQPTDFAGESPDCSDQCIAGMLSMTSDVFNACGGNPQNDQGILGAFLVGSGVISLCPNAGEDTSTGEPIGLWGPSTTTPHSSSTEAPSYTRVTAKPYTQDLTTTSTSTSSSDSSSTTSSSTSSSTTSSSDQSTSTSSTSSPVSSMTTTSSTTTDLNNPPSGLPTTGALQIPSTSMTPDTAQQTGCVQKGGGGSLIGDGTCSSAHSLHVTTVQWLIMSLGIVLGARALEWRIR